MSYRSLFGPFPSFLIFWVMTDQNVEFCWMVTDSSFFFFLLFVFFRFSIGAGWNVCRSTYDFVDFNVGFYHVYLDVHNGSIVSGCFGRANSYPVTHLGIILQLEFELRCQVKTKVVGGSYPTIHVPSTKTSLHC